MPSSNPLVILLVGDPYIRRKKIDVLISKLIQAESRDFNLFRFNLKETSAVEIVRQARSMPMMGENQVFLIQNLQEWKKDAAEIFEDYFKKPAAWSYLILEADELKLDHPAAKIAVRYGKRIDCAERDHRDILDLIHQKLKNENCNLTRQAWQMLEEKTGGNLTLLDACVDKLILYAGDKPTIDAKVVEGLADQMIEHDVYDLTNALSDKNAKKALEVFRYLYDLEGSAMAVIGLLNWQLKRIWQAKKILNEEGESALTRKMKVSVYQLPHLKRQAGRFSEAQLKKAFDQLFDLDWKVKTGACHDQVALEAFLVELCSPVLKS